MLTMKNILVAIFAFFAVAQSQQFQIQNWGNGEPTTNYTYKSLTAGRFTLDWVLGPGGNFVAGKGYKGSPNLLVFPSNASNTLTDIQAVSSTTPRNTTPPATPTSPSTASPRTHS